jgi:hypothetical protein
MSPLVPGHSHLEVEISIAKLKKDKLPGSDHILAELIQAGGEILLSAIHKLINSVWNIGRSLLLYQFTKRVTKLTNNYCGISSSYKMLLNILLSRFGLYINEIIGDLQCGF